jgi:hypothetical protein
MTTTKPKALPVSKRRESASGFHYLNLFQCCQRKFYLRYHLRIRPNFTHQALIAGSAFHEGKATFYTTKSEPKALAVASLILKQSKKELEFPEDFKEMEYRTANLLHSWIEDHGKMDLKQYKVLFVEKELRVPIAHTQYVMTMRPDAILQDKMSKLIYVYETKTSSFSHRVTNESVLFGDQATSYLWGVRKLLRLDAYGVVPDISFWAKNAHDVNAIKNVRGDIAVRSDYALEAFEKGVSQVLSEINQKSLAYKRGRDPWLLFPRNSHYCLSYSTPCEFASICYEDCEAMKKLPSRFRREPIAKAPLDFVEDQIDIL